MDREQRPRRRNPSASGDNKDRTPERRRRPPEASGDKPISRGDRSKQGRKRSTSPQRATSRRSDAQRQKAAQERQHRQKQQLRRQKQQQKIERAEKRRSEARRRSVRPFDRRSFFLRLGATLAVVLALVVALTIFFKVDTVQVSGNMKYTNQEVIEASGIEMGENLLLLSKSGIAGRIHTALPYVGDIQVGIKLPNTVNIDIVEQSAVFSIQDESGVWWLLSSTGTVLESTDTPFDGQSIRIEGAVARTPVAGEVFQLVQTTGEVEETKATDPTDATESTGETDPTDTTDPTDATDPTDPTQESVPVENETTSDRKAVVLEIMEELTSCDRSGDVTVVDVGKLSDIQVWYGDSFQILLYDASELSYKVRYMVQAVESLTKEGYRGGVLDLSFREAGQAVFKPW